MKVKIPKDEILKSVEVPPTSDLGDYSFPCFSVAKTLKYSPHELALELKGKIGNSSKQFEDIQVAGPYVNFFINSKKFSKNLLAEILKKKENFGKNNLAKSKRVMVEFPSPNTNKPLHVGHLRNLSIGESVSRIIEFSGGKVVRANLNNDKGVHICKSLLAYKKFGKGKKPTGKLKSDHLVGEFYVMFNKKENKNKELISEAHEMLRKWEKGDRETIELWKKMRQWSLDGFNETYKKFGISFDKEYFESEIYTKGREIILEGVKKKIFEQEKDGSVFLNLETQGLGKKYLLRADGTTLYMTQDIYLAKKKFDDFKLTDSIYVVGQEQEYHFNVLFNVLEKLGFSKGSLKHLSHGMVNLPEGKMKSREGKVVDADDLIELVQNLAKKELSSREKLSKKELEERSLKITLAAIKYLLLKIDRKKDTIFNPKKSISFEGDTGPYLLYTYARANSIIQKINNEKTSGEVSDLEKPEKELIKKLFEFPDAVESSYKNLNPSLIANYSFTLAKTFTEFYHNCPVIDSKKENFRIQLVKSFLHVMKNSLNLLGIEVLERM